MKKKETRIAFALAGIQTLEFAMMKESYIENVPVEMGINVAFGIKSVEEHEVICSPEISFLQDNKPFLKIKTACFFSIEEDTWTSYLNEQNNSIIFPKGFTDHLLMISIGTLRGILHAKTEGTLFNQFIIPTINVVALTNEDIEIFFE